MEITVPGDPVIVDYITHTNCFWGDVKVYRDYAYVVNECGGGMDIVDLSGIDEGIVTLVQRFTEEGLDNAHNLAIDKESGFLYLCLPNINDERLVAYDLTGPENPMLAGMMSSDQGGDGLHDAQVITYKKGPYAGRQICFGAFVLEQVKTAAWISMMLRTNRICFVFHGRHIPILRMRISAG